MSVEHTIRNSKGGYTTKKFTGMKAIRAFCLECVMWDSQEVKTCTAPYCPLFPFRFGTMKVQGTPHPNK